MVTMGFIQTNDTDKELQTHSNIVPETFTHSITFGETGSCKTSSFIYPNLKERISLGHGILLYDYKGKEHLSVKAFAYMQKRLQDVVEIGKPWGEKINLVQNMDEDELDKFFDILLKHGDDNKYWQNSAKSLGQLVLGILNAIESTASSLEKVDSIKRETIAAGVLDDMDYPTQRTLKTLVEVCKTFESLKSFISNLNSLVKEFETLTKKVARYALADSEITPSLSNQFADVIANTENLRTLISDNKNLLDGFGEDSNENLTQNIIGTLIAPLMSLAKK